MIVCSITLLFLLIPIAAAESLSNPAVSKIDQSRGRRKEHTAYVPPPDALRL